MTISDLWSSIYHAAVHTSFTEWLIFVNAMIYVILAAFENPWCWLFGILCSLFSILLCYQAHLFLESGLQVFYVIIGVWGWYQWISGSAQHSILPIRSDGLKQNLIYIACGVLIWLPFWYFSQRFSTQVLPWLDALITSFSLVTTWMTAKKILQNWLYWVVINSLAIVLYGSRGFYLIALLYFVYTIISVAGYFSWKRKTN